MSVRRDSLPEAFSSLLVSEDVETLEALLLGRDADARDPGSKRTALAFDDCPDDLARWLVGRGANLQARDGRGDTPLHVRARSRRGRIAVLLELGADPGATGVRGTPLHAAAEAFMADNVRLLLGHGASVDAEDGDGHTSLERALAVCRNVDLVRMADLADVLLTTGARKSDRARDAVAHIGARFEFFRESFNPALVAAAEAALDRLCLLFDAAAPRQRHMHDGRSPIIATAPDWRTRHAQLWDLLVPSSGAAATVQGEVVRIAGRIARELDGNGGGNWDAQYRAMAKAWLGHVASGVALPPGRLREASRLVAALPDRRDCSHLCELAVDWVALNPSPVGLPPPPYDR